MIPGRTVALVRCLLSALCAPRQTGRHVAVVRQIQVDETSQSATTEHCTAAATRPHRLESIMSPKRSAEEDAEPHLVHKIQRIEHVSPTSPHQRLPNNDFSNSVKRKLADSKRTGQACDRCKVRPKARRERQQSDCASKTPPATSPKPSASTYCTGAFCACTYTDAQHLPRSR